MFNNLANYLLGTIITQQDEAAGVAEETNLRLTSVSEDDWILVDRDSEGNSEVSSDEDEDFDNQQSAGKLSLQRNLTRTSSSSSLPCATMEESWFLTPPACFTSAGPIHMETSPLENLLIEHPSMSVYQHSQHHQQLPVNRRYISSPIPLVQVEVEEEQQEVEELEQPRRAEVVVVAPRRNRLNVLQLQERQCVKNKQAQKVGLNMYTFYTLSLHRMFPNLGAPVYCVNIC